MTGFVILMTMPEQLVEKSKIMPRANMTKALAVFLSGRVGAGFCMDYLCMWRVTSQRE
jgi:hypothetical protein